MTLTVRGVNDGPVADDERYDARAGVTLEVAAPGVLEVDLSRLTPLGGGTGTLKLRALSRAFR